MRIIFAGTPEPAVPTLRALLESPRHHVVAAVTRPAAPAGRGQSVTPSPVAKLAADAAIPVLAPDRASDPDFLAALRAFAPECCAVVAYGSLLRPAALAIPRHGWVNLHFSLLPAWRGAAPVQHALMHGDDVTGASTFRIEEGLDTGPVFGVVTESVRADDTAGDLLGRLAVSGANLMLATMDGIADGSLEPRPQSADGVSLAPKVTVADAQLDWLLPARHLERLARACTPTPGPWTTFRGERLKLGPVRTCDGTDGGELAPGELRAERASVTVGTATADVELTTVQAPGKRAMPASDWVRGARLTTGERLG